MTELKRYFWDSYALIEFILGNAKYEKYINEPVTITILNLIELYNFAFKKYGKNKAIEIFCEYKKCVVPSNDEIIFNAIEFRSKYYPKKNISYVDAIGYVFALKNNLIFLTGDNAFKDISNVEFVQK